MTTVSYMLASALSLLLIAWCTSFVVATYVRAVIRGASVQASRAGAVSFTSTQSVDSARKECQDKLKNEINNALSSSVTSSMNFECTIDSNKVRVNMVGNLRSIGLMTPFSFNETTTRSLEVLP